MEYLSDVNRHAVEVSPVARFFRFLADFYFIFKMLDKLRLTAYI